MEVKQFARVMKNNGMESFTAAYRAMRFTKELLEAEIQHIQQSDPSAIEVIRCLECAAAEVEELMAALDFSDCSEGMYG